MYFSNNNFNCISCTNKYNNTTHIPLILNKCGHTLCKPCLLKIIIKDPLCPYCKEKLNHTKITNYKPSKDILNCLSNPIPLPLPIQASAINQQQPIEFWHKEKGKWYYISNNNKVTGWVQWNESWFYFRPESGEMMKGWINDNGKWYYLHSNGEMAEGWIKWESQWYYLNPDSGSMKTGWCEWDDKRYYLSPYDNGKMKLGWLEDEGKRYYLDPNNGGAMVKGQMIINNISYYFNDNGEYIYEEELS